MKKIFLVLFLLISYSAFSQDLKTVIKTMPDNIIFGLDESGKILLESSLEDTTSLEITRGGLGNITMLAQSPDFISLKTSESGTTSIKILSLINDSKIVCVVKTVCAGICDSQVQFFTMKWTPIDIGGLFPLASKDWFLKKDFDRSNQTFLNAYTAIDMFPIKLELSPDNDSIKAFLDLKEYLSDDDLQKISPYLIENPIVLTWDKSSYKLN